MKITAFIHECRERKLIQSLSIYAIVSWLLIQIAATTFPFMGFPKEVVTLVIILALLGLPVTLLFSWYYNVVADPSDESEFIEPDQRFTSIRLKMTMRKWFLGITSVVSVTVLTIVSWLIFTNFIDVNEDSIIPHTDKIAVYNFTNNTGDSEYDIVGKMVASRIIHGITQNDLASVITDETIKEYSKISLASLVPLDHYSLLNSQFSVGKIISGNIYLDGRDLIFECTISDTRTNAVTKGLETTRSPASDPLSGIEKLKQIVLGFLASNENPDLHIETSPPKYEAFKELLLAKDSDERMLYHLNRAIQIDSNYFEAKVLRLSYYYNEGDFLIADSILRKIDSNLYNADKRQKNLLNLYDALLKGKNNLVYQNHYRELQYAPFDIMTSNSMIVVTLQFVNDAEKAFSIYQEISEENLDLVNCKMCLSRLYLKMYIDLELNNPYEAIRTADILTKNGEGDTALKLLIRAYVQTSQWKELDQLLAFEISNYNSSDIVSHYLTASKESTMAGNLEKATYYAKSAKERVTDNTNGISVGEIQLLLKDSVDAEKTFELFVTTHPYNLEGLSYLAGIKMHLGKKEEADILVKALINEKGSFQYGEIDYMLARSYLMDDQTAKSFEHLKISVIKGQRYRFNRFKNDFNFVSLRSRKEFKEILTYWQ